MTISYRGLSVTIKNLGVTLIKPKGVSINVTFKILDFFASLTLEFHNLTFWPNLNINKKLYKIERVCVWITTHTLYSQTNE